MQCMSFMLRMKDTNKLMKNVLRALPAIPMLWPRKKASVLPYILGAVGVAIAGGIAAVMILSPRTRTRTLGIAKESYGKVRGQLGELAIGERLGLSHGERTTTPDPYSNGLGHESDGAPHASNSTF
jgi:hypothetical protein